MRGQETNTKQTKNTKQKNNKNPHNQTKNKTGHNPKTARLVISWSVHSHLKRIRRDDNIVSPLGLVWQNKTRANNKSRKCHTAICEPGSNKSKLRTPRLPPARSLEITECFFSGRRQLAFAWSAHFETYLRTSGESNRHR